MENKYKQFWSWFVQNRQLFEQDRISDQSVELIDQEISSLGDFAWEIGPGRQKSLSLTISPGGDPILLSTTKKIISYAPILDNWEFNYAKPTKEWDNYFDVIVNGKEVGVDISQWEYVLFRSNENSYDIEIKLVNIPEAVMSEEDEVLYGIVEMVLESIIGEEKRLERIDHLEILKDDAIEKNASSILNLNKHLDTLP
jgi:hypothetical protein